MTQEHLLRSNSNRRRIKRSNSLRSNSSGDDDRDDRGWTNLPVGARKGDLKEIGCFLLWVKRLLDEGMDANVAALAPKSHGLTPLHLFPKGGHIKVMDELLERGANIDAQTKGAYGWTPLHTAAKEKNKRANRFLIDAISFG
ncbi:hypothetical protein L2E82_06736 [Cichorium intybus]|uniref:Uncharacterized protein n=1 Tax=Cichorium intybus TaxID=13427 RepID=A0ACB9HCE6_CICIN|nr:hypothetical protein L2E82_06736 [Cichorium intybus]